MDYTVRYTYTSKLKYTQNPPKSATYLFLQLTKLHLSTNNCKDLVNYFDAHCNEYVAQNLLMKEDPAKHR